MTDNPLRPPAQGGTNFAPSLDDYAADLNRRPHMATSGEEWFVGTRRREDGTTERYLDRRERRSHVPYWHPSQEEIDATKFVVADYAASDMTQEEFNSLCRRGRIAEQVDRIVAGRRNARLEHENRTSRAPI